MYSSTSKSRPSRMPVTRSIPDSPTLSRCSLISIILRARAARSSSVSSQGNRDECSVSSAPWFPDASFPRIPYTWSTGCTGAPRFLMSRPSDVGFSSISVSPLRPNWSRSSLGMVICPRSGYSHVRPRHHLCRYQCTRFDDHACGVADRMYVHPSFSSNSRAGNSAALYSLSLAGELVTLGTAPLCVSVNVAHALSSYALWSQSRYAPFAPHPSRSFLYSLGLV